MRGHLRLRSTFHSSLGKVVVGPITRARAAEGRMPQLVSRTVVDLKVNPPAVEGPPVVLEFERMIGRQPVGLGEYDVYFVR